MMLFKYFYLSYFYLNHPFQLNQFNYSHHHRMIPFLLYMIEYYCLIICPIHIIHAWFIVSFLFPLESLKISPTLPLNSIWLLCIVLASLKNSYLILLEFAMLWNGRLMDHYDRLIDTWWKQWGSIYNTVRNPPYKIAMIEYSLLNSHV